MLKEPQKGAWEGGLGRGLQGAGGVGSGKGDLCEQNTHMSPPETCLPPGQGLPGSQCGADSGCTLWVSQWACVPF